ncbi:BCCT family transporter [Robertkochia aurantiaca]|uniref:BCCT family transporter n=1 Tax=Robertkochia aurantiaca TaxID=2873700 RepID=UPI001CD02BFD|nr:BCCT family transporter [Robertkochia sp. 3YJGBD-33]
MFLKSYVNRNKLLVFSVLLILIFSLGMILFTEAVFQLTSVLSAWIRSLFGRYYLWLGLGCVLLLCGLALSPLGSKRIGKATDRPEHSRWSWIAMLYSAGMGAGVLLRAVQEPVYMFLNPPVSTGEPAPVVALEYTFYQWGLTAWAFYALFALIIGYAFFTKGKLILVSAAVENQVRNKRILKTIDLLVILTTVIGVVAAICLGTTQITGGLSFLSKYDLGIETNITFLILIMTLAFISVWSGLNRGIKSISNFNILLTLSLLFFTMVMGDMSGILISFFNSLWEYIKDFILLSLAWGDYNPGEVFLKDWTYYYWAFWISWAPFTGVFIARISKGRTIREFVLGVMIIPSLASFFWFSVFGHTAMSLITEWGSYSGQFSDEFSSIFVFFSFLPFDFVINPLIIILLIGFLVTSVDSAVYVLSMFSDRGVTDPNKKHRLLWSVLMALTGIGLLILSNVRQEIDVLNILQIMLIVTSLPFSFFIPYITFHFVRELSTKKLSDK